MKSKTLLPLLLLGLLAASPVPSPKQTTARVMGEYVEARTASVFAGPCHYNAELITDGRQALMAWNITAGKWNGVDLAGVRAMASVTADDSLGNAKATRTSELVVDRSATDAQVNAVVNMIKTEAATQLGTISTPTRATILFSHDSTGYTITASGFGDMTIQPMPNNECCSQPHNVWYSPLSPTENRKVGYTQSADYTAGTNGATWERSDENSAFYGTFSFEAR